MSLNGSRIKQNFSIYLKNIYLYKSFKLSSNILAKTSACLFSKTKVGLNLTVTSPHPPMLTPLVRHANNTLFLSSGSDTIPSNKSTHVFTSQVFKFPSWT